jgi:hypothetical protein
LETFRCKSFLNCSKRPTRDTSSSGALRNGDTADEFLKLFYDPNADDAVNLVRFRNAQCDDLYERRIPKANGMRYTPR